jgi:putative ABC transport system permease protein
MGARRVVGVVSDVRWPESTALAIGYIPFGSDSPIGAGSLVIKTTGDPLALVPRVRAAVYDVLPDVPLRDVQTMDQIVWRRTAQRRLNMLLLGLFGVLGLAIAVVGLYGLMAYLVTEQTREIGIRIALGATRARVVGMFLRRALALVAAGLAIGAPAAWALRRTAASFLFQMDPGDPRVFAVALAILAAAALVAAFLPARRAAGIDPLVALRAE